jgi:hypothetical protein
MHKREVWLVLVLLGMMGVGMVSQAAGGKTYQVTGPVLELTEAKIVVQKGSEKWEIARTADTKVTGELKVGAKVTIEYTMTASSVTVKDAKAAKDEKAATPTKE